MSPSKSDIRACVHGGYLIRLGIDQGRFGLEGLLFQRSFLWLILRLGRSTCVLLGQLPAQRCFQWFFFGRV